MTTQEEQFNTARKVFFSRAMEQGDGIASIAFALLELARLTQRNASDLCSAIESVSTAVDCHGEDVKNMAEILDLRISELCEGASE